MKKPLVSVIMPVHNGASSVADAIESILNQSFKDFELIINNDGSTDDTQKIIDSYKDPRIVPMHEQKNVGIAKALNHAIDRAQGTYLARQDADDTSLPLRLERQVALMTENKKLVLVGTNALTVDSIGKKTKPIIMPGDDSALRLSLFLYNPFIHGSVMFRAAAVRNSEKYDSDTWPAEDYDLWRRLSVLGEIGNIEEPLYSFMVNDAGISQTNLEKQTNKNIAVRKNIFKNARSIIGSPLTLRRALQTKAENRELRKSAWLILRVSLLHARILAAGIILLNIICALPRSLGRVK